MLNAHLGKPLLKKNLGRLEFIKTLTRSLICQYLNKISIKHIAEGQKQVAVFAFDFIGHQINLKGFYERQELTTAFNYLLQKNLIRGSAADVGANIGNHSLFFQQFFNKVFSFEPNQRTFKLLKINAELVENIECFNVGLSDVEGSAILNLNTNNIGGSHISQNVNLKLGLQQEIILKTLDSYEDTFKDKLGLVKIDVEGHELAVLKGAIKLLKRDQPVVLFEQQIENFVDGKSPVVAFLESIGYLTFLSVKPFPNVPTFMPKLIQTSLVIFLRTILGFGYQVRQLHQIPVDSYPFIIALPSNSIPLDV